MSHGLGWEVLAVAGHAPYGEWAAGAGGLALPPQCQPRSPSRYRLITRSINGERAAVNSAP